MAIFTNLILAGLLASANVVSAVWQGPGEYIISSGAANLTATLGPRGCANGTAIQGERPTAVLNTTDIWVFSQVSAQPGIPLRYWIVNAGCGTALTNSRPATPSSNQLIATVLNPRDARQVWTLDTTTAGSGRVIVRSLSTPAQVIDLSGSGTTPGTAVLGYPLNGASGTLNQHWDFNYLG